MYLKTIEIQGFKSFANKTVLNFEKGITGIVGPNGSGKSNVADAVRWVLGEQKVKQLRGASMQDVIFSGTELRKPQSYAFVAITLDNSDHILPVDYTEVTVSRRLFRSGESEYMINSQQVRLRDVQELFYDTGIGKEGYSIIGQGQVEAILNGKPEDRRGLFDEACGIVKFKRRKAIAEKKLESERANLVRINDILSELSGRVEPLKKQSENARLYLGMRDELKKLDLNLFLRESRQSISQLEKTDEGIGIARSALEDVKEESTKLTAGSEKLQAELSELEESIEKNREQISENKLTEASIDSRITMLASEAELKRSSIQMYEERITSLSSDIDSKTSSALGQLSSISELRTELRMIESDSDEGTAELSELLERADRLKDELIHVLGDEAEEILSQDDNKDRTDEASSEASDEEEDPDAYSEPEWLRSIRLKRSSLGNVDEKSDRLHEWLKNAEEEYNQKTLLIKDINRSINDRQQEYHMAATKLESLRNLSERYEGYGQSIKSIMQKRSEFRGIEGVVADLISTEAGYETAVETALGGAIQNIVTDTEDTAKRIIGYLKKNKLGRATFLPLDAIKSRDSKEYEAARNEKGVIGLASEIVSCDGSYKDLVNYLLGRTLVADSIDSALLIARKYGHRLRIVTLQGELLLPGGSISGGAFKNNSNLLGRQRELSELKQQTRSILEKIDALNEQLVNAEKEASRITSEIDDLKSQLSDISLEKNRLSLEIISEFRLKLSGISQKAGFVMENLERLISEIKSALIERDGMYENKRLSFDEIKAKEDESEILRLRKAELEKEIADAQSEALRLNSRKEELTAYQKGFFSRKDELSSETLRLEKELIRLESSREKLQQHIDEKTEYIWTEYELTLSDAAAFEDQGLGDEQELSKAISGLRRRIRELGDVNVNAIEEYREVSERFEFLTAQHDDLVASEASILSVIDELDKGMKRQFAERFAEIRKGFDGVFRELFGGGSGDLELQLTEEEDELSAGIAIIAQPPGKKLQNMMQLSGGEKALTAIALLFAIQAMKPSPFCLLDEIEAALDDSNIDRFAAYLSRLTDRTQFIVITHRRGTMESCDRLYGITMQEKGITALVSVDLVSDSLS